ncbi:DUF362 domain-containing protein [Candidatus Bathyarchaeota archaeon]|nr:DUF362 domain-containing protein [Candidatus Bathyarchaeota archaeon]
MGTKVAIVKFEDDVFRSFKKALDLVGKVSDLNTSERSVVIKVGVFDHKAENHSSVSVVDAIIRSFDKAQRIYLAESDNYRGKAIERLQVWKELFNGRVIPFSLSNDAETKRVEVADEKMQLSHILFKPNVFVSTHILRTFERGSIIKNLFGLVPDVKKAPLHKKLDTLLPGICEAIGGIDLAVIDGTYLYRGAGADPHATKDASKYRVKMNTLIVGRDAIAVETVGATLAGLKPDKMPILKEAVKRHLGEGNIDNIEIVGSSLEKVRVEFTKAARTLK